MEKDAYMLQEKRAHKNSPAINNSVSLGYRTAIIQHELPTGDDHTRSARNLNKPVASCSSPDRSDTYPHASTLAYTSLRRHTFKQKSDRVMNNQTDHRNIPRASYPFLTPPVSRREVTTWGASNTIGSPQTVVCLSRGEYTSLLRPSTHVCEPRDCPSRPSSSIPLLSLTGPTISESTTPGCGNIPMVPSGRRLLSTPTGQILCQTSTSYPCCSACDPSLAGGTSALLDSYDLIGTGDHQTDSIQNCPQCQMMGTNILSTPCCPENCSLLHAPTKRRTVSTENTNSPHMDRISPIGYGEADSVNGPQCSTTYMSMQEMLNSCV
ncbi:hypothetical protein FGIG_00185 [Fasciola gigantica]|uniref:Uncharacterized protein n=1 Tax=Fasciola gigantica TaxID=46835 RepID=A0A504YQT9_FASGI|nr:hypothetical protein FGIG_00185 [Fasciola gigantica]